MATFNRKSFLTECLFQHVEHGEFELASGGTSAVYIDARPLLLDSFCLSYIAVQMCGLIDTQVNTIAGIGFSGALLVPAILLASARHLSGLIVREEPKRHGRLTQIEGDVAIKNQNIALVDDILSTGSSLRFASQFLKKQRNCTSIQWVVMVDRSQGKVIHGAPPISAFLDACEIPGFNDEYKIKAEEESQAKQEETERTTRCSG